MIKTAIQLQSRKYNKVFSGVIFLLSSLKDWNDLINITFFYLIFGKMVLHHTFILDIFQSFLEFWHYIISYVLKTDGLEGVVEAWIVGIFYDLLGQKTCTGHNKGLDLFQLLFYLKHNMFLNRATQQVVTKFTIQQGWSLVLNNEKWFFIEVANVSAGVESIHYRHVEVQQDYIICKGILMFLHFLEKVISIFCCLYLKIKLLKKNFLDV